MGERICIIMAVYNGEKYLREQIDSLLQNSCQEFTLHIFDDGSSDASPEIIRQYEAKYPEQIVGHHNKKNRGVILNFLEGTQVMDADYYMFCDQDDVWCRDKIRHTLDFLQSMERHAPEQPIVVFGDAKVVDERLEELAPSFQTQSGYRTDWIDLPHLLMENKLIGCTVMFNRRLRDQLTKFPPEIRMHDWWIALVGAALGQVGYLDEPLLLYRQHGKNVVGNTNKSSYIKNRLQNLQAQRDALHQTFAQAEAFLTIYEKQLNSEAKEILRAFAGLANCGWFARRYRLFRYHFWKSGIVRNLGVFLLI